jgi:hypothetical protein
MKESSTQPACEKFHTRKSSRFTLSMMISYMHWSKPSPAEELARSYLIHQPELGLLASSTSVAKATALAKSSMESVLHHIIVELSDYAAMLLQPMVELYSQTVVLAGSLHSAGFLALRLLLLSQHATTRACLSCMVLPDQKAQNCEFPGELMLDVLMLMHAAFAVAHFLLERRMAWQVQFPPSRCILSVTLLAMIDLL